MMLHVDPAIVFDHRVRRLSGNAELLFWRGLFLAGILCREPLRLTLHQFCTLKYDLAESDSDGYWRSADDDDIEKYVDQLIRTELLVSQHGDADNIEYGFAEDLAFICFAEKANEANPGSKSDSNKQIGTKTAKQVDPELSRKRSEAGRKGGRKRKKSEPEAPFTLRAVDEGAA